jgi:hypothetical protein
MRGRVVTVIMLGCVAGGCIPKERDFLLIPSIVDASGEVDTTDPGSITARVTISWDNGDEAPETQVMVDSRFTVEDEATQDVLGRIQLDRVTEFDGTLSQSESADVVYEGTQAPPIAPLDPADLCDGREVHLQVLYSTQGSLTDFPLTGVSNTFVFDCG